MHRRFRLLATGSALLFGITLVAIERPTPEFQRLIFAPLLPLSKMFLSR